MYDDFQGENFKYNDIQYIKFKIYNDDYSLEDRDNSKIRQNYEQDIIEYMEFLEEHFQLKDYIWQRDHIQLNYNEKTVRGQDDTRLLGYICGMVRFDDSLDDEWFIVEMLFQLTKKYKNLTVSVQDNDGDFLLIEAAKVIPKWLKPSNSQNRLWIKNSQIHLIPLPSSPSDLDLIPQRMDIISAIRILSKKGDSQLESIHTIADDKIHQCVLSHFKYSTPEFKVDQYHWKSAYLPIDIAYLIHQYPHMIAPIVQIFYHRDADDMKALSTMSRFPISKATFVPCKVRFTRTLYGAIHLQKFNSPRSYPPLPQFSDPTFNPKQLGMKLHCAIEMLYQSSKRKNSKEDLNNPQVDTYKFNHDENWDRFVLQTQQTGYFENEKIGSKKYKEKLQYLKQQYLEKKLYLNSKQASNNNNNNNNNSSLADFIDEILKEKSVKEMNEIIGNSLNGFTESSDDYLNQLPHRLEDLLNELEIDNSNNNNNENVGKIFESILNSTSSIDGINFKKDQYNDEDEVEDGSVKKKIKFDPNAFMNVLDSVLGNTKRDEIDKEDDEDDDHMYDDLEDQSEDDDDDEEEDDDDDEDDEEDDDDDDDDEDEEENDKEYFSKEDKSDKNYIEFLKNSKLPRKVTMKDYMNQMDVELNNSTISQSFETVQSSNRNSNLNKKVDLNLNLVKNILDSLNEQKGIPSATSTLLKEYLDKK
ncbi:SGT1 protein [Tieghemostelium lacteum]|uniref:SGT1 protein n=1 Tax=Tieghemostelium lacteum TaxID=361077 RepID=A0A151Z5U0_TIELA|nr:SGT1 protein [Tieghemostelium lacteum]|eukprot:KYQ89315.1 SGT1 protein [Tieghemostelium lacteum]